MAYLSLYKLYICICILFFLKSPQAVLSVGSPGDYKVNLIPSLIGPFLEVTLVPQPDLRNVLIPVFHDMMDREERRSGNFKQVMTYLTVNVLAHDITD